LSNENEIQCPGDWLRREAGLHLRTAHQGITLRLD
jgi:hypothetical protein